MCPSSGTSKGPETGLTFNLGSNGHARSVRVQPIEKKEELEKELREVDEVERLRVQQRVAACANGRVCVCAYGGSRNGTLLAMGPPVHGESGVGVLPHSMLRYR